MRNFFSILIYVCLSLLFTTCKFSNTETIVLKGSQRQEIQEMLRVGPSKDSMFKKDIAVNRYGFSFDYAFLLGLTNRAQLISLENGFDSLALRFWYRYKGDQPLHVIEIRKDTSGWLASLITLKFQFKDHEWDNIEKTTLAKFPKSGFRSFTSELYDADVLTLPDCSQLQNYEIVNTHGAILTVEIATSDMYKIYTYAEPNLLKDFSEAVQIEKIINIIERELDFKRLDEI